MIPFFRPSIGDEEIEAVTAVLKSGWLTTGEQCHAFEAEFASYVGARYAVAVNSCTAALHLALEAVGIQRGDLVLVPTFTFAATAEVVRYFDAVPVLIDCEPFSLCMDLAAARRRLESFRGTQYARRVKAIIPMHYAGQPLDVGRIAALAEDFDLRVVEDAAHALPASYRASDGEWHRIGADTADATCFSFYANKTITTGEGGMLVTDDANIANRTRVMALHGISKDAWNRFSSSGSWYYEITAPGFKYNMTDVAAALGRCQLRKCDAMASARRRLANVYGEALHDIAAIERPEEADDRLHAWHLYVIRLNLDRLRIDRAQFVAELKQRGVTTSVAWMPLHLHPYYRDKYAFSPEDFPVASREWMRIISLPLFPDMVEGEQNKVVEAVRDVCKAHAR